jgi:hypothetical protein
MRRLAVLLLIGSAQSAGAHSASDAYLTLTAADHGPARVLQGQWDIALRDLNFALDLEETGDGQLTWGQVRRRQSQIEAYAYRHLRFAAAAHRCTIKPLKLMLDEHADGAYAALMFGIICPPAAAEITLDYDLFFDIDPSHRAIFVMRSGDDASSAVLSPQNAKIALH